LEGYYLRSTDPLEFHLHNQCKAFLF